MNNEERQEASVPMQSRVNLITLAGLVNFWESQGFVIRSMSSLISWSLDLLVERLKDNKLISAEEISLAEANKVLEVRRLYQRSFRQRSMKKIAAAMAFESLRNEGTDPRSYVPEQYRTLHNRNSVQPAPGKVYSNHVSDEELFRIAQEKKLEIQKARAAEKAAAKQGIENGKASGLVVSSKLNEMPSEKFVEASQERDRKIAEAENAPVEEQLEFMRDHSKIK